MLCMEWWEVFWIIVVVIVIWCIYASSHFFKISFLWLKANRRVRSFHVKISSDVLFLSLDSFYLFIWHNYCIQSSLLSKKTLLNFTCSKLKKNNSFVNIVTWNRRTLQKTFKEFKCQLLQQNETFSFSWWQPSTA